MEYKVSFSTDKGTVKEVNQDSVMVKVANTKDHGRILLDTGFVIEREEGTNNKA